MSIQTSQATPEAHFLCTVHCTRARTGQGISKVKLLAFILREHERLFMPVHLVDVETSCCVSENFDLLVALDEKSGDCKSNFDLSSWCHSYMCIYVRNFIAILRVVVETFSPKTK